MDYGTKIAASLRLKRTWRYSPTLGSHSILLFYKKRETERYVKPKHDSKVLTDLSKIRAGGSFPDHLKPGNLVFQSASDVRYHPVEFLREKPLHFIANGDAGVLVPGSPKHPLFITAVVDGDAIHAKDSCASSGRRNKRPIKTNRTVSIGFGNNRDREIVFSSIILSVEV